MREEQLCPDHLRRCWTAWDLVSIAGGSHLSLAANLIQKCFSPLFECCLLARLQPISQPSIQSVPRQLVQKKAGGSSVKCFVDVQVNNIDCSPHVDSRFYLVEGDQPRHDLLSVNPCWLYPTTCFIWLVTASRTHSITFPGTVKED